MGEGNEHEPLTVIHAGEEILVTEGSDNGNIDRLRYVGRGSIWQRRTSSTLQSGGGSTMWVGSHNDAAGGLLRGRGHYALLRAYCADEGTTLFTGTAAEKEEGMDEDSITMDRITESYTTRKEALRIRCWWCIALERKGGYYFCEGGCMGGHSASEGAVRLLRTRDDGLGCSTYDRGLVQVTDGEAWPGGWTLHRSSKFGAFAWAVPFSGAGLCAVKATAAHPPEEAGGRCRAH